jgi:3D (Asp-Asp-Asp) domain-containing protein
VVLSATLFGAAKSPAARTPAAALREPIAIQATDSRNASNANEKTASDSESPRVELSRYDVRRSLTPPVTDTGRELMRDITPPAAPAIASPVVTRKLRMQVTAYCACTKCCGPNARGITASGLPVSFNNGAFVAADTSVLAFRTHIQIPGYNSGQAVQVIDRGGAIKGNHIDVYFPTHEEALQWGRQWLTVSVIE